VTRSENIEAVRKCKKGNFWNSNQFDEKRKESKLHRETFKEGKLHKESKLHRETFRKGKLFERVRRLETKFSEDDQSSSSHHSEVIEDYKSLLSKLQSHKLHDDELIQI
jgi:hypothetical protein